MLTFLCLGVILEEPISGCQLVGHHCLKGPLQMEKLLTFNQTKKKVDLLLV
jgi:hypothetical protein